ncbi:MAG TPA: D-alanyl-D-alanine carboxypeptidase/D-alanyl-D-alanine-endopeptidase [Gemmatimonadaceae bacterium]|nr:D-alanyl-D-alanine carboxypeptidase/D-alanyl-D-alanine-endopeptidase [Gemmatimonadaceae bacterium]
MLYRKLRFLAVILLAAITALPVDGQTRRRRTTKKPTASAAKKRTTSKSRPSRARGRRPVRRAAAPKVPVVLATTPRSAAALSADLGSMANRVRSGLFGIMAVSLTKGDTLFTHNAGTPLVPASTLKMLTAAIALDRLGPKYQFSTDVLYDGTLGSDGTLNGNIYLRGDGDPTLGGRYMGGGPGAPMNLLAEQIAARGIRTVTGEVIGDATAFDDERIPQGWLSRYLQAGYAARVSGLSLNENLIWVTVTPGQGAKLEPATSAIPIVNNVRTVRGGGARLSIRRTREGAITVSGTIGTGSPPRRYVYVVEHPAPFATGALRSALVAKGIAVAGGIRLGKTPGNATKIASVASPTLDRILAAMNRESINHYAELVLRNAARGRERDKVGNVANSKSLLRQFFAGKVGADSVALQIADGSGLSTLDRVTSRAMVQMLGYAHRADWGPYFHASLPVAGESELMRRRMRGGSAQGNLHAKTGTTNDVVGLGGYVTALNGEVIAFSFIYNGRDRWTAKSMMDAMGQTMANFAR